MNKIYLQAEGELKYQINIKKELGIEEVIMFKKQADLIKKLEEIEKNFKNEEEFFKFIKENVKICCFCKMELYK